MADPSRLDAALARLNKALGTLDSAVMRRLDGDKSHAALTLQLEAAETDRERLAADLDEAAGRMAALETTNREVARRIDQTMDAIRGVLRANGV